ncbi:MAG TPA: hypothetical protein VHS06_09285, partial [Chloroflexota bacterium]|nr:hypothetical protein [Chloroflexota bacterium]
MSGEERRTRVRSLVTGVLGAAEVPFVEADGCLSAELSREAMTALEGRWGSPATVVVTFDPETAARHPEADLIAPGSFRLDRFLAWIRREVQLSRAYLPALTRDSG